MQIQGDTQDVAVWKHGPKSKIRLGDRKAGLHFRLHRQRPGADQLKSSENGSLVNMEGMYVKRVCSILAAVYS